MIEAYFDGSYSFQHRKGYSGCMVKTTSQEIKCCMFTNRKGSEDSEKIALLLAIKQIKNIIQKNNLTGQVIHIKGDAKNLISMVNNIRKNKTTCNMYKYKRLRNKYKILKEEVYNSIFDIEENNYLIISWIPRRQNLADKIVGIQCNYFQKTHKTIDKQFQLV